MLETTIKINRDETYLPILESGGIIIKLNEVMRNGTLHRITQSTAILSAQLTKGGYILTLAGDVRVTNYLAHNHENSDLQRLYQSVSSGKNDRWTRSRIFGLRTSCPILRNIKEVISQENSPPKIVYGEEIKVPWLPKTSGYIQELDIKTGLPRKIGDKPNKNLYGAYYAIDSSLYEAVIYRAPNNVTVIGRVTREKEFMPGFRVVRNSPENIETRL